MNPELLRNLWLELQPRRVLLMAIVIGAILMLGFTRGIDHDETTARTIFYALVVIWGTRCAARSIVEEIAGRTWDAQRLSAIRPWTMVWGKLLGSTSLAWVGGAICLVAIVPAALAGGGHGLVKELAYFLSIGLLSQAVAMLVSQVAIRRDLSHSRFDVFLYQLAGLAAALAVWRVWQTVDPDSFFRRWGGGVDPFAVSSVSWWGQSYDTGQFYAASLVLFAAWTLIANYRVMRVELQMRNGPLVWFGFLAFITAYMAGFDPWRGEVGAYGNEIAIRSAQASLALAIVTYVMVFAEPKAIVAYRRLLLLFQRGHLIALATELPAWSYAYGATAIAGLVVFIMAPGGMHTADITLGQGASIVLAALGFILRDCLIVVAFGLGQRGKRSDIAALAILALLYIILPQMGGVHGGAGVFFYPSAFTPIWLSPLIGWGEAAIIATLILRRPDLRQPARS